MKRVLSLFLALCLAFLWGCTQDPAEVTTQPTSEPTETATEPTAAPDTEPATEATVEPATEPTEPEPVFYNPLTGEPMDEVVYARPFAVSLNNSKAAQPQHGIGAADVVYETLIEGETRCLGIYYNLSEETARTIGTIRSARYYFVQIAQSYDAIFVHNGSSSDEEIGAKQYFQQTGWEHMDGISTPGADKYYYRDRADEGYRYEHTLFIKPQGILDLAAERKFRLESEQPLDYGLTFDDNTVIVGKTADQITAWFNFSGKPNAKWHKSTTLTYDPAEKVYYASQYGGDYYDGNDDVTISFRNVLVLRTSIREKEYPELVYVDVVGSGTGYYACNGQVVEINWSRESVTDPFTYTLASNGKPVTFGVGKTYVAIVPNKATVEIG